MANGNEIIFHASYTRSPDRGGPHSYIVIHVQLFGGFVHRLFSCVVPGGEGDVASMSLDGPSAPPQTHLLETGE
jgi:hypothetical protein